MNVVTSPESSPSGLVSLNRWASIATSPMLIALLGEPFGRSSPSTSSTSAGSASIECAAMRTILSLIVRDAPRTAPESMIVRRLPPGPAEIAPEDESL